MPFADYSELKTEVRAWLHRSDLDSKIPSFIYLGEWRLARDLRVTPLMNEWPLTIGAGGDRDSLPPEFIEAVKVKRADNGQELQYLPPQTIDRVPAAASPWAYTLIGTKLHVVPSPWVTGGEIRLLHFWKQYPLSDANPTNWYLLNAPGALLYASLLEAEPHMKNDARVELWKAAYDVDVGAINKQYGVTRSMTNAV